MPARERLPYRRTFRSTARFLPVLKQQLADAERMVAWAKENDSNRVLEMSERVASNLGKMIAALESETSPLTLRRLMHVEQA